MTTVDRSRLIRDNRWISIQMEQWVNRTLEPVGLTAAQASILLHVLNQGEEGTSLTAIHRAFGYSMPTLSGMLKRLREKGYLRVEPCADDDRCKKLLGTEKGRRLQRELEERSRQMEERLYSCFTGEELRDLDALQRKLLGHLSILTDARRKETIRS